MKYLIDLLKISLFVFVMYIPLSWLTIKGSLEDIDQQRLEQLSLRLSNIKSVLQNLLKDGRILEACQRLNAEYDAHSITTFTLLSDEASCYQPEYMKVIPPVSANGESQIFLVNQKFLTFVREKTSLADWAISVPTPEKTNFIKKLKDYPTLRMAMFKDIVVVIYIIFSFILFGVLVLAKSIQNQYRKRGRDPFWLKIINFVFGRLQLHDLKVLKAATSALIKKNESLLKDQDLLETSLEFSILNEIKNNQYQLPFTFFGTVAKVDINGFSKMVSAGHIDISNSLTTHLENFGCELLLRYEGLFEKTVGDEIVVVFRGENSDLLALSFARDLMYEFSKINFLVDQEVRSFTLKSSIYSSELIFLKRVSGYGFLGEALTYGTRLLGVVDRKDCNILSCLKSQSENLKKLLVLPDQSCQFDFKNMNSMEGYLVEQFLSFEEIYQSNIQYIKYFRSDRALFFLLEKVATESDLQNINTILNMFSTLHCRQSSALVQNQWVNTIKIIESRVGENTKFTEVLSSLIMDGAKLIPKSDWADRHTEALLALNRRISGRINASIVDVLMEKDLSSLLGYKAQEFLFEGDESYRTQGNLLVLQALQRLSSKVLSSVIEMIQSSRQNESLTGIYSACQILNYYLENNPATLETFSEYKVLVNILQDIFKERGLVLTDRLGGTLQKTILELNNSGTVDL